MVVVAKADKQNGGQAAPPSGGEWRRALLCGLAMRHRDGFLRAAY